MKLLSLLLTFAVLGAAPAAAQEPHADSARALTGTEASKAAINHSLTGNAAGDVNRAAAPGEQGRETERSPDIIMPHITDSHEIEVPWINGHLAKEIHLPRWKPVQVGGLTIDLSPTKHVVAMLLAAILCVVTLVSAAVMHTRHHGEFGRPKGFAAGIEGTVLWVRDEVILKNVGPHGEGYVPFLLTTFFFVLFANMLGLVPYGSTATGNIAVTATLATMSFLVIEIGGMRTLGPRGYLSTILYWPSDMKFGFMKILLAIILTPVELLGKFTKPFALAIRLFANMTAGHVIVLAFIGMVFTFNRWYVTPAPIAMALGIMLLEVLVGLIQAYIFTLLTSVFIGQIREAHH